MAFPLVFSCHGVQGKFKFSLSLRLCCCIVLFCIHLYALATCACLKMNNGHIVPGSDPSAVEPDRSTKSQIVPQQSQMVPQQSQIVQLV